MRYDAFLFSILLVAIPIRATASGPTAGELVAAALAHAGLDAELDEWSTRARWSNLVPEFDVLVDDVRRDDFDEDYREIITESDEDFFDFKTLQSTSGTDRSDRLTFRIRARIRPGGLIFDEAEVAAERLARARALARERLIRRVSELAARRVTILERIHKETPRRNDREDLIAVETELDALTDGALSRRTR